jgi:hypothetical protein
LKRRIAPRLFRTIARLGNRGIRKAEVPVVDAAFLKPCGIAPQREAAAAMDIAASKIKSFSLRL